MKLYLKIQFNSDLLKVTKKVIEILRNKKVLLRERKRHTDRGVSSTPSVTRGGVPPRPGPTGRGYPRWGTPCQGTPPARSDGGYLRWGTPLARSDRGGGTGTSGGVPPPGWLHLAGVPPPPLQVWTDKQSETTYAVGNNLRIEIVVARKFFIFFFFLSHMTLKLLSSMNGTTPD